MKKLDALIRRLQRIGIDIKLDGNYPWIYLGQVNGKKVVEKHASEHGFVIGFLNQDFTFTYSKETFQIIRKYINDSSSNRQ